MGHQLRARWIEPCRWLTRAILCFASEYLWKPNIGHDSHVFVHGLGGHPRETWERRDGSKKVFWPQELLLLDFSMVKVRTSGYNATPPGLLNFGNPSSILQHCNKFTKELDHALKKLPPVSSPWA